MSNEIYTIFENKDGKAIVCGKRPVLVQFTSLETIANAMNEETAPLIEALEEKALENAKLRDEIERLKSENDEYKKLVMRAKLQALAEVDVDALITKVFSKIDSEPKEGES